MQEVRKHDADIDCCPTYKGVWLDRGELDKVANMQTKYDEDHYRKYHRDRDYDDYYERRGPRRRKGFLATFSILTRSRTGNCRQPSGRIR